MGARRGKWVQSFMRQHSAKTDKLRDHPVPVIKVDEDVVLTYPSGDTYSVDTRVGGLRVQSKNRR